MKKLFMNIFLAGILSADVVVIVNPANNIDNLSADQLKNIFLAKTKSFPNGETSVPVDQKAESASYSAFYEHIASKNATQMNKYWVKLTFTGKAEAPKKVDSDLDVVGLVKNNKNMIGYVDKSALTSDVKVVYTLK